MDAVVTYARIAGTTWTRVTIGSLVVSFPRRLSRSAAIRAAMEAM